MTEYQWDVFISHASEDKTDIVLPIAYQLEQAGFKVWLDQHELRPGYSLREQIDNGLAHSRFGIIVISKAFMQKPWTRAEMNAIISRDIAGRIRLIPLWHDVTFNEVTEFSPILADRFALYTCPEIHYVVHNIIRAMLRDKRESLTLTGLFLEVLQQNPTAKRVTDFLLAHSVILKSAISWNSYWCSGGKVLELSDLPDTEDFILGVLTPGTEGVWVLRRLFFLDTDLPLYTTNGQEIPAIQKCGQLMGRHLANIDLFKFTEAILSQHSTSREEIGFPIVSTYNLAGSTVIARRRADLNPDELALISRINQERKLRIRTYDWLLDACRSWDYGHS